MSRSEEAGRGRRRGGFLLGAIAGAIAGLLLAPRSGKETRAQLFGATDDVGGQVGRLKGALEAGREQAADQSEALRRKIQETRDRLSHEMAKDEDAVDVSAAATRPYDQSEQI